MLKTELSNEPKWPNVHYGYAIVLLDNILYLITYRVVLIKQDAKNETLLGYPMNLLKRLIDCYSQIKVSFRLQKWFDSNVPSLDDSLKKSDNEKRPKICLTKSFLVVAVTNVTINQCDKYKNVDCRILICHHWILKIMIIFVFNKANEMISQRNVTAPKSQRSTIKITLLVNELNHFYCCFM